MVLTDVEILTHYRTCGYTVAALKTLAVLNQSNVEQVVKVLSKYGYRFNEENVMTKKPNVVECATETSNYKPKYIEKPRRDYGCKLNRYTELDKDLIFDSDGIWHSVEVTS